MEGEDENDRSFAKQNIIMENEAPVREDGLSPSLQMRICYHRASVFISQAGKMVESDRKLRDAMLSFFTRGRCAEYSHWTVEKYHHHLSISLSLFISLCFSFLYLSLSLSTFLC